MPFTKIPAVDPQPEPAEENGFGRCTLVESGALIALDEIAVRLDTGEQVAVSCTVGNRDFASQTLYLTTCARVLDDDGNTAVDGSQDPAHISTKWIHGATVQAVDAAGGLNALRSECLRLVLGEAPTMIGTAPDLYPMVNVPDEILVSISIRRAIAAAGQLLQANTNADLL